MLQDKLAPSTKTVYILKGLKIQAAVTGTLHWAAARGDRSDHPCHRPRRVSEFATEKWNGKTRLACVSVGHPPLKTSFDMLSLTCRVSADIPGQIDLRAKQPSQKWLLDTLSQGHRQQ